MKSLLLSLTVPYCFVIAVAFPQAEFVDHPVYTNWIQFPVGTTVTLHSVNVGKNGNKIETTTVVKLISKSDKDVVISRQITSNATGQTITNDPFESTIRRKFPLFPGVDKSKIGRPQGIIESGKEKIELLGKTYQTEWYVTKGNTEAGPSKITTWISNEFPGQVLKMLTEVPAGPNTTEEVAVELIIPEKS
jgi:hypothetical protein